MSDDQAPPSPWPRLPVSRRRLLQGLGLVLLETQLPACGPGFTLPSRTRSVDVVRPEDRLWLRLDFYNLDLDATAPADAPRLVRQGAGDAYVVITFPPQSVGEQALLVNQVNGVDVPAESIPPRSVGLGARLSGESRLAFRVPDGVDTLPYTLDALLDWSGLEPSLAPAAKGPTLFGNPSHRNPNPTETALELPWWLVLSPLPDARWAHAAAPVTHGGRTELWHTRLGIAGTGGVDESASSGVRAVWTRDPQLPLWLTGTAKNDQAPATEAEGLGLPFRMSATPRDRFEVLRNTSDWSKAGSSFGAVKVLGYRPEPFAARRLHLSSLGATADLDGAWNPPQEFGSLVAWAHRLSFGRDVFARIVHRGFLYPFGHACVEVTLTERKFRSDTGERVAYLVQRQFLVITERTKKYGGALGLPLDGRAFPFREVEVVTRQTRDFAGHRKLYGNDPPAGPQPEGNAWAYQPMVDVNLTEPVVIDCLGTDWTGRVVPFQTPFVFVADADDLAFDAARMETIATAFATVVPPAQRTAKVGGHKVAFAEEDRPDDTSVELHELVLGARKAIADADATVTKAFKTAKQLCGFPSMVEALVAFPATQALAGASALTSKLQFVEQYLEDGFGATNPGGAFLQFAEQKVLDAATDAAGGLVSPTQQLTAVTRALGPVGGQLQDVLADRFDPKQVFDQFGKLLGGVPLKEILQAVNDVKNNVDQALKWVEQRLPTELVASFKWKPKLQKDEPLHVFEPGPETTALFEAEARQSLKDPNARSAKASGELTKFRLNLIGDGSTLFLRLDVAAVRFRAGTGQKTSLDVDVEKITFDGALSFVEALRPFLEALGQGPAALPIPKGIEVTAGLHIPKVQMGVFQLANLGFDAKLVVPFTGDPVRFRFRFATKEDPFTLSVSIFGGTGYFALGVGADGVELVEIAFEFGGMLALDVGVASGSIKAVAGIYLKLEKKNGADELLLSGYLKLTGQLQVLGIVSVSLLLDLSFQYLHKPLTSGGALDIVTGRARCELKVSILFFSVSVGFDVEKSFGGDPADPTVGDQFSLPDWQEYAAAFA